MDRDYFQDALQTFNGGDWYGWKKDWTGKKRMSYENVIIIKEGATMPTKEQVDAKIVALKQAETNKETKRASAKKKLQDLGLTVDEIKEAFGI